MFLHVSKGLSISYSGEGWDFIEQNKLSQKMFENKIIMPQAVERKMKLSVTKMTLLEGVFDLFFFKVLI